MTEEENKAIEDCKELIKDLKNNKDKDFIGRLYYKGKPIEENLEILLNLIEKLKKETIPTKYYACDPNKYKECKKKHCYINGGECDATIDETKVKYINLENYIPKDKIKGKIKEYNKEIKTYEDKMLEITQREKHHAIENKDYINYSCIIANFVDKIKLLEELLEEE